MAFRSSSWFILVGIVLSVGTAEADSITAPELLARYRGALAETPGFSVTASRSAPSEPPPTPGRLATPETASLQVLPPGRYRIDVLRNGKHVETVVSDGREQRLWNAKFFTRNAAPRKLRFVSPDIEWAEKAYWPLTLFTSSALVEHLVATRVTSEMVGGKSVHRLQGATHLEAGALRIEVWFDGNDFLPRKVVFDDGQGAIMMAFTVMPSPPDPAVFTVQPPDGLLRRKQEPEYPRVSIGGKAPAFSLKTPEGKSVALASMRNKVVLLDFWATWCPACKLASPFLDHLQNTMGKQGFQILAITTMSPPADLKTYLQSHTPSVMILHDPADEEQTVGYAKYLISGLPSYVLVDAKGNVQRAWKYYWPGATETRLWAHVEDALEGMASVPVRRKR